MAEKPEWQVKRDEFWKDLEIFDDALEPVPVEWSTTYLIHLPDSFRSKVPQVNFVPFTIYVDVMEDGLLTLNHHTVWYGKTIKDMKWDEEKEILDYLIEWELARWVRIGPEDSEVFATEKLTGVHYAY